jgi:zinc transporter 2
MKERFEIPEAYGTPMPVKTPINFAARRKQISDNNRKAMRKLALVSFVSVFFIIAQVIGGILSNSIAIFTDTAHLASDLVGFAISIISLTIA